MDLGPPSDKGFASNQSRHRPAGTKGTVSEGNRPGRGSLAAHQVTGTINRLAITHPRQRANNRAHTDRPRRASLANVPTRTDTPTDSHGLRSPGGRLMASRRHTAGQPQPARNPHTHSTGQQEQTDGGRSSHSSTSNRSIPPATRRHNHPDRPTRPPLPVRGRGHLRPGSPPACLRQTPNQLPH